MQTRVHNFEMKGVWNNKQIIKYTKKRLFYINSLNIHHNFGRNKMWPKIQDANKAETSKRVSNLSSAQLQRKGKLKCGQIQDYANVSCLDKTTSQQPQVKGVSVNKMGKSLKVITLFILRLDAYIIPLEENEIQAKFSKEGKPIYSSPN